MNRIDTERVSKLIISLRKQHNMSQEDFGGLLGVSQRTVRRWEKGMALPTMEDVVNICNEFSLSLEDVFAAEDNEQSPAEQDMLGQLSGSLDNLNSKLSNAEDRMNCIHEMVEEVKNEVKDVHSQKEYSLDMLWFIIVHLLSATLCFLFLAVSARLMLCSAIVSLIYCIYVTHEIIRSRKETVKQGLLLLYSVILAVNLLFNYMLFKDTISGIICNTEIMVVNGPLFGLCIISSVDMTVLLGALLSVYTLWAVICVFNIRRIKKQMC